MSAYLQYYFESQEYTVLFTKLFDDPLSEARLHFVYIEYHKVIIQLEKEAVSPQCYCSS